MSYITAKEVLNHSALDLKHTLCPPQALPAYVVTLLFFAGFLLRYPNIPNYWSGFPLALYPLCRISANGSPCAHVS